MESFDHSLFYDSFICEEFIMSKKKALILLVFFDLLALLALWLGYDVIGNVVAGVANSADVVGFNNRVGFLVFAVACPITHIYAICDYLFFHDFLARKTAWVNAAFIILGVVLFASALFISAYMQTYVERAGYLHCAKVDKRLTFSKHLVYSQNYETCSRLVVEK